jgi:hypothetical protein
VKRLTAASVAVLMLALGVGSATAGSGGATIESIPASFSLSSTSTDGVPGGCQYLPAGLTITWSGLEKSITLVRTDRNGVTTIQNTTHAYGKASDQNGGTYAFNYSNSFHVTETSAGSGTFSGQMTDHFSLAGGGIHLSNGFVANITTDFASFTFDPIHSNGDPIDFATVAPHCDPL